MLSQFDRSRLVLRPLHERVHDLSHINLLYPEELPPPLPAKAMADVAELGRRLVQARERKAAILLLMGAHVLRAGVQRQLIDLMERGLITHIGMNGAGPIHDYEMSRIGATCESVARYIKSGEFGLWRETGEINDIVKSGAAAGLGLGEAIGKAIQESRFPHKDTSVLAAGFRLGVPVTVHVGIGYDIIHEHPNFDPAAFGTASYRDFLAVCHTVDMLEGGVFLCFGSAVMGPEVYLKALSMARNVAHQEGRQIANFTTAAFDLIPIQGEWHEEAPKSNPQYYYRPWKTILVRTVADGGESFYVCGDHRQTVPYLRKAALAARPEVARASAPESPPRATEVTPPRKIEVIPPRMTEVIPPRMTEVIPPRKPDVTTPPKSVPAPVRKPDVATPPKAAPAPVRKPDVVAEAKSEAAPPRKSEAASAPKVENLGSAVSHYQQLKEWVRTHDAADLDSIETSEKEGWHHSTITKDNYLRLFYRTVWTAGFKSRVVVSKEQEYFRVVKELLFPQGRFQSKRQGEFLMKVASVLGGSGDNRKNKAVFHVIDLIESLGWDEFRSQYVTPQAGLAERLQKLPMIGPKSVKLLLTQTGVTDPAKDDVWVLRFADQHGYGDAGKCIREIAARTGDAAPLIDFVIWDAGHKEGLTAKS